MSGRFLLCVSIAAVIGLSTAANATSVETLTDQNSTLTVDLGSDAGLSSWTINGINQLHQEWLWYRIGDTGPQHPLSDLVLSWSLASNGNRNPGNERLVAIYQDTPLTQAPNLEIELDLVLTGAPTGSPTSDLAATISIRNLKSSGNLNIHLFQYGNFDLSATPNDNTVGFPSAPSVRQTDGATFVTAEMVTSPLPDTKQIAYADTIYQNLKNVQGYNLVASTGTLTGDVTWAYQWNLNVGAGGQATISQDTNFAQSVPLPASVWMGGGLLVGIAFSAIRRQQRSV